MFSKISEIPKELKIYWMRFFLGKRLFIWLGLTVFILILQLQFFGGVHLNALFFVARLIGYTEQSHSVILDEESGISLVDYGTERFTHIGIQYNPIPIARNVIVLLSEFEKTSDQEQYILAKKSIEWLVENLEKNDFGFSVWIYHFDYPRYRLKAGWYSAMAQGLGIEALLKAYKITYDQRYLKIAMDAFSVFTHDLEDGGVRISCERGWWYEEYSAPYIDPLYTLNGFIYSIFSLKSLYEATYDINVGEALEMGIKCLESKLPAFDIHGIWSRYNLSGSAASEEYHSLHIRQLHDLYALTGKKVFKEYSEKWKRGTNIPVAIRLIIARNRVNDCLLLSAVILSFLTAWLGIRCCTIIYDRRTTRHRENKK